MSKKSLIAVAAGSAFVASMAAAPIASAAENPFALSGLSSGYQVADHHGAKPMEGKCGGAKDAKAAEGKCGGAKDAKAMEGKCGGDKAKVAEGKCGGDKAKAKEGKCGEGKCGAKKMEEGAKH